MAMLLSLAMDSSAPQSAVRPLDTFAGSEQSDRGERSNGEKERIDYTPRLQALGPKYCKAKIANYL